MFSFILDGAALFNYVHSPLVNSIVEPRLIQELSNESIVIIMGYILYLEQMFT